MLTMAPGARGETGVKKDWLGDVLPAGAIQRLGTTRMTYKSASFCYLPNDRALVANGNKFEIVDLARGVCLASYAVGTNNVQSLAATGDGRLAVAADAAGDVALWDLVAGRELRRWATGQKSLVYICIAPDGKRALTTGCIPATLKEWDLATGRELVAIAGPQESFFLTVYNKAEGATTNDGVTVPTPVQFSRGIYGPGGKTALVGDNAQASLLHYNLADGAMLHQWYPDIYTARLALSADGKRLLVGSRHRGAEWDLADYRMLQVFTGHHGHQVTAIAYGRDPEILTGSRDGSIRRWDRREGKVLLRWVAHQRYVTEIAVAPDGKRCLSFGAGALVESELQTGAPRLAWDRHRAPVLATAFLPSGKQAASSSGDGTVRLWNAATGKTVRQFALPAEGLAGHALAVSPDGATLAVGGYLGIWEFKLADGQPTRELKGHRGIIRALAWTSDGRRLLSGADDGSIKVWKTDGSEPVASLDGHRGGVLALATAPDSKFALSGGRDGTIRLWDLEACTLLKTCEGHAGWVEAVAFPADSRQGLSAGRDGRILKWDLARAKIEAEMQSGDWLHALACSPDGREAYSAGEDGKILCWDLKTGLKKSALPGHEQAILGLAIAPDGQCLASASRDNTLLIWNLKSNSCLQKK